MLTPTKALTSLKQLPKQPATYRDLIADISSLPYPIGDLENATCCSAIGLVLNDVYKQMNDKDGIEESTIVELINYIRFNYKTIHPLEVKVAYDMYFTKNLKVEFLGSKLNKKNISALLNAYLEYKNRILAIQQPVNKSKSEVDLKPEVLRQKHIEYLKTVVRFYEKFKQGTHESTMAYMFYGTYDTLVKYELIDKEADEEMLEKARVIFKHRFATDNPGTVMPEGNEFEHAAFRVYKELRVNRAFEEIQFAELDLEQYLMERVK